MKRRKCTEILFFGLLVLVPFMMYLMPSGVNANGGDGHPVYTETWTTTVGSIETTYTITSGTWSEVRGPGKVTATHVVIAVVIGATSAASARTLVRRQFHWKGPRRTHTIGPEGRKILDRYSNGWSCTNCGTPLVTPNGQPLLNTSLSEKWERWTGQPLTGYYTGSCPGCGAQNRFPPPQLEGQIPTDYYNRCNRPPEG